ncbi:unnamed protein product [Phytophthora lilii]|uniref:Unnamed protein product n=1 Tax=Phytophthora lilii TaxID=2077276 RepID=A0A9W6UDN0_9STRA|nr:unnamed protein product [Phytophthora lilii]
MWPTSAKKHRFAIILFGEAFDAKRYERVLQASQLAIGRQKARVAIARAMYWKHYDILLSDYPQSAVDPHVAHGIFNECVAGLARSKTRILVLNSHYDLLVHADKILVVRDGVIAGDGSYDEVLAMFPELTVTLEGGVTQPSCHDANSDDVKQDIVSAEIASGVPNNIPVKEMTTRSRSDEDDEVNVGQLIHEEDRVRGTVTKSVYNTYFDKSALPRTISFLCSTSQWQWARLSCRPSRVTGSQWPTSLSSPSSSSQASTSRKQVARLIKRLDGVTRTPVYNLFSETLSGLQTIRAFKMQEVFKTMNKKVVDENGNVYITTDRADSAMTSAERLLHFRQIPQEVYSPDCMPINVAAWPSQGAIKFDNVCLKLRPDLPLLLMMDIRGGEKVGICGRTGAGKSSRMIALFRTSEFTSGSVAIDGLDILKLKLNELRRSLAIIPQDPVLFSGPLCENLDPFGACSDAEIWAVRASADPPGG